MTRNRRLAATTTATGMALLYLPLLAVVVLSLNQSRLGLHWGGFTLNWYARAWKNPAVLHALTNTLLLAAASTAAATVLGTALAIGIARYPWPRWTQATFSLLVHLPVVTPDIIFAAALLVVFRLLREMTGLFNLGMGTMIIAHVTFQIAFVALVVRARLATIEPEIEEAARDLYATNSDVLRKILLPLLAPGIVAGALLAFTLSLDDFVISFFTSGPESATLPIYIFSSLKRGLSPEIHAVSTVIFLVTAILAVAMQLLSRSD
ncbi:MAG TPA: ABC transporter permease [Tepidisphaeraceae bacterium]|jgi:spermidine/putrescine transport system permease protein